MDETAHPSRANINPRNSKLPILVTSPAKYARIPPNKSNRIVVKSATVYVGAYAIEHMLSKVYIRRMHIYFSDKIQFYRIKNKENKKTPVTFTGFSPLKDFLSRSYCPSKDSEHNS